MKKNKAQESAGSGLPEGMISRPGCVVPIVGIGASAGGLEALAQFLSAVPSGCGLAFVIVQHLDPTREGLLVELLQRATAMPVVKIAERMKVTRDSVYVIPPNRDVSVSRGHLHLREPPASRGLRLPIDFFFRSLAEDQKECSLGVVLSGMGADGTLGLRSIKEQGGAVFVQTPESAKFDNMPRSAIAAGLADSVAVPAELPAKIIAYVRSISSRLPLAGRNFADGDQADLEKIIVLLRKQTGHDFSLYKKSTLYRRIERRMGLHQRGKMAEYVCYLRENPQECDLLFKELLIGVTSFFRDPEVWEHLRTRVFPELIAARPTGGLIRAWVTACSTGEEAYSLAMVFREALDDVKPVAHHALQIFATDLDQDAIDKARIGLFPANIAADVSEARLRRFFIHDERGFRVGKEIRERVVFATQDLVRDPPFTKLDILACRNLLIYLEPDLQKKLLPLFHYSLNPGGFLVLGSSESVGQVADLFQLRSSKSRIFRRQPTSLHADSVEFPSGARPRSGLGAVPVPIPAGPGNLQVLTESLLLSRYAPAAVLTTGKGDIVYVSGKTGKYLEPAAGKANLNLFAMTREGLSGALHEAFAKAIRQKKTHTIKSVSVRADGGGCHTVDVTVQPLAEPSALRGLVLVVFANSPAVVPAPAAGRPPRPLTARLAALQRELQQTHEEVRIAREEMQASQEELKSTNEELQSTNEELQSTNEELTTSKEELQSMNEELQTVNHELQAKVDDLSQASDDMENLLNSTEIACLFLDDDLNVRRFTTQAAAIIKLIPRDIGRPITDLVSEVDYPGLAEDARQVLRSLIFQVRHVPARDGRWFCVRLMPYRTQENLIKGVVITFVDITSGKNLESALREALAVIPDSTAAPASGTEAVKMLEKARMLLERHLASQVANLRPA